MGIVNVIEYTHQNKETRKGPTNLPFPSTIRDPLQGFTSFQYNKAGKPIVRMIKPGKLTPFVPDEEGYATPPVHWQENKLAPLPNGKYRHIASYTLNELIDLGWCGAMYVAKRAKHDNITGQYVPFITGYDSDEQDEYEPIDVEAGKRAGIIGRPLDEKGRYMVYRANEVHRVQLN